MKTPNVTRNRNANWETKAIMIIIIIIVAAAASYAIHGFRCGGWVVWYALCTMPYVVPLQCSVICVCAASPKIVHIKFKIQWNSMWKDKPKIKLPLCLGKITVLPNRLFPLCCCCCCCWRRLRLSTAALLLMCSIYVLSGRDYSRQWGPVFIYSFAYVYRHRHQVFIDRQCRIRKRERTTEISIQSTFTNTMAESRKRSDGIDRVWESLLKSNIDWFSFLLLGLVRYLSKHKFTV